MRLILKDGIPHWESEGVALPVTAGAQDDGTYTIDQLAAIIAGENGGGGVRSAKGVSIVMPDGQVRQLDVLTVPGRDPLLIGYVTGPDGKPQGVPVQPGLYQTPLGSILNINNQGQITEDRTIPFNQWAGGGTGAGSDHYSADMQAFLQKMQDRIGYWQQQIENVNSSVTYEAGKAGFEADWATLVNDFNTTQATLQANADTTQATLTDTAKGREITDIRERETQEALRRTRVAEEAGSRAKTIVTGVLPSFVPGDQPIPVPYLGPTRGTRVNFGELFNQGGAGNLNTLPPIAPQFAGGYGATQVAAPPQLPPMRPMPTYPGAVDYPNAPQQLLSWLGL